MLIAIERADGGVSIMNVVEDADQDACVSKWSASHPGEHVRHREIKVEDIPRDRTFRDAWQADLTVDMAKARVIWRDKMRAARAPRLAVLDTDYMRADERGDVAGKAAIAARKQELRDVTALPAIEAAKTPDDLEAIWPDVLG